MQQRWVKDTAFHPPTLTPTWSWLERLLMRVSKRRRAQATTLAETVGAVNAYHRYVADSLPEGWIDSRRLPAGYPVEIAGVTVPLNRVE